MSFTSLLERLRARFASSPSALESRAEPAARAISVPMPFTSLLKRVRTRFASTFATSLEAVGDPSPQSERPSAMLHLTLREQVRSTPEGRQWLVKERGAEWEAKKTAIVVCDMWNRHWCPSVTDRVAEMAPRLNEVLRAARQLGVFIIHCPSETMRFYRTHPGRKLAQAAPRIMPVTPTRRDYTRDPTREPPLPFEQGDDGCDAPGAWVARKVWSRQIETIDILPGDAIAESEEPINLMRHRGITQVILAGVHANLCILTRPYGIRNLVYSGLKVVLLRDLTDAFCNPGMPPFVDHHRGTQLFVEHIERFWCPTVTSSVFVKGPSFRFKAEFDAASHGADLGDRAARLTAAPKVGAGGSLEEPVRTSTIQVSPAASGTSHRSPRGSQGQPRQGGGAWNWQAWRDVLWRPAGVLEPGLNPHQRPQPKGVRFLPAAVPGSDPLWVADIAKGKVVGDVRFAATSENQVLGDVQMLNAIRDPLEHWSMRRLRWRLPRSLHGTAFVLASPAGANIFHWLLESLPRLRLLESAGLEPANIDYFLINEVECPFHRESLERLGIPLNKTRRCRRSEVLQVDRLIVTATPFRPTECVRWAVDFLRDRLLRGIPEVPRLRLYIARHGAARRRIRNEEAVERLLMTQGFRVVCMERIPWPQQAALFACAEAVVAPHGAALAHLAFASPGIPFIELFAPSYQSPNYRNLAQVCGMPYRAIVGSAAGTPRSGKPDDEDFSVPLDELRAALAESLEG